MTTKQIVNQALAYRNLSNAELARRLDWSPQLLSKRLATGKLSPEEWAAIGEAIGAEAKICFQFPDGTIIP